MGIHGRRQVDACLVRFATREGSLRDKQAHAEDALARFAVFPASGAPALQRLWDANWTWAWDCGGTPSGAQPGGGSPYATCEQEPIFPACPASCFWCPKERCRLDRQPLASQEPHRERTKDTEI
jgi:hypothetical protein